MVKESYHIYDKKLFENGIVPKKWMFDDRSVEKVILPCTVRQIGDWAFSHCRSLKEVWIPKEIVSVGAGVFDGCDSLERIVVYGEENKKKNNLKKWEGISVYKKEAKLLALALCFAPQNEVFDFSGFGGEAWYAWFDDRLVKYLSMSDAQGFSPFLAGGEEDYEEPENDVEYYCFLKQQEKCRIVLERLLHSSFLEKERSGIYTDYLSVRENALLAVLLGLREQAYNKIKLCGEYGLLDGAFADRLLREMTDGCYTECRAYILRYKEERRGQDGIWGTWEI